MDKLVKVKYELLFIVLVVVSALSGLSLVMWIFGHFWK